MAMTYTQANDFGTGASHGQFTSPTSSSSVPADRKGSFQYSSGSFNGLNTEWSKASTEAKLLAGRVHEMPMSSSSTMETIPFKTEPSWSPNEQSSSLSQPSDFDPLMPDLSVHSGGGHQALAFDPNVPTPQGIQSDPTSQSVISSMQNGTHFDMTAPNGSWIQTPVTEPFDYNPLVAHGARTTPVFATSTNILRRDGIRKKNARFEIPAERNLRTIDQLIAQTNDESEVKELKQQKRLLRNRQAALDSRQRKKQHTERLEEEKKQYTNLLNDMDEELNAMKSREADLIRQRDELLQNSNRLHQWCQQLQTEKEDLIRSHTIESGQLRKENSMLLEQLQRADATSLSAPGSTGVPADFSDFEQLTIQNNPWENFTFSTGLNLDTGSDTPLSHLARSATVSKDNETAQASGLLLMLLLCGAWLVSKSPATSSSLLPSVPDELRAASACVIKDLYKDSGIVLPGANELMDGIILDDHDRMKRTPDLKSGSLSEQLSHSFTMEGIATQTQPRMQQSMLMSPVSTSRTESSSASHLGQIVTDALRSSRALSDPRSSSSERFVRSALADKVPHQVLKDFADMVARGRPARESNQIFESDEQM